MDVAFPRIVEALRIHPFSIPPHAQRTFRTFFVMIKLVPMAMDPETASARPIYLSSTMVVFKGVRGEVCRPRGPC